MGRGEHMCPDLLQPHGGVVSAMRSAQQSKGLILTIALTIACAFGFMGIKYVEYSHKIHDGLLPGRKYFNPSAQALEKAGLKVPAVNVDGSIVAEPAPAASEGGEVVQDTREPVKPPSPYLLQRLLHDDRAARHPCRCQVSSSTPGSSNVPFGATLTVIITDRSTLRRSTGTWSTWCGFTSSRCFISFTELGSEFGYSTKLNSTETFGHVQTEAFGLLRIEYNGWTGTF